MRTCPNCRTTAVPKQDPDSSYFGEMLICEACGFRDYFDAWDENAKSPFPF